MIKDMTQAELNRFIADCHNTIRHAREMRLQYVEVSTKRDLRKAEAELQRRREVTPATRYATRDEAIVNEILPVLGEHAADYDVELLADGLLEYCDGAGENADFPEADWLPAAGYHLPDGLTEDEFWEAVYAAANAR